MSTKTKPRKKKLLIILAILVGILGLTSGWFYFQSRMSHPLGDKLEYIGKRDYGCRWLCGSRPGTTYSYATDMTPPELLEYFPNARVFDRVNDTDQWQGRGTSFRIHFFDKNDSRFTIAFRTDVTEHIRNFNLKSTTKPYLVEIDSDEYQIAKDSL